MLEEMEKQTTIDQILKRDARVHEGSEVLWEYTKNILDENVKNGNIKTR